MMQQEFDSKLTHIEDQAAAMQERVDGYRDQEMAKLFIESEWSHEDLATHLAKRWGKEVSPSWVQYRLRFGRFLSFFNTTGVGKQEWKLPTNLTERSFRRFWDATQASDNFSGKKANTKAAEQDERRRFAEVLEELKNAVLSRPQKAVRQAILDTIAGKQSWLTVEEIRQKVADHLEGHVTWKDVRNSLDRLKPKEGCPYRVEKSGTGETAKYRLVRHAGKVVSPKLVQRWSADLLPMLEDLIREAKKGRVEISLSHLCDLASKIEKVLQQLSTHQEV